METVKINVIGKRRMVCGKTYPTGTRRTRCECEASGWLYAVGAYYSTGGGKTGGNKNFQKSIG